MRKLTMTLTAAVLVLGTMAMTASAQTQAPIAVNFHAPLNYSPRIITEAACNGRTGVRGCGPGWFWACGPYGHCRCVRC